MIERGDVFLASIDLPNRKQGKAGFVPTAKYFVALQGGEAFAAAPDLAIVIASTHRRSSVRPFEVLVGKADGFDRDTVLDCRWVYTLPKSTIPRSPVLGLSSYVMHSVSVALVVGLQMT